MTTFKAWGLVAAVTLAQVCAAASPVGAQASGLDAPARPAWCQAPPSLEVKLPFSSVAAKLKRQEPITVVAIGSSSTEGSDLPDKLLAYPTQLQRHLSARLGTATVKVLNKGRGGETMLDTIARFDADVAAEKPDLVIWQLGVNDIVRGHDLGVSEQAIETGLIHLHRIGAPVVMMDMQLAPRVTASAQLPVMKRMLKAASAKHKAVLWSRYELMESIIKRGAVQLPELIKPDDLHMTVAMHTCTGAILGDMIAANVATPPVVTARSP